MYKVVPVENGMIGGHYAIKDENGKLVAQDLGLDLTRANKVANLLNKAYQFGMSSRAISHGQSR